MADKFDIIEYLSGLTGFVFDKAVLKRIALDRGVCCAQSRLELSKRDVDLCRADLLYTVLISPNTWASSTHAHGSFSQTIGSQQITEENKEKILDMIIGIYKTYGDDMLSEAESLGGTLQWLDY